MRIAVVGTGYVGLTVAACLAAEGRTVVAIDRDRARIAGLRAGRLPFAEPGLAERVAAAGARLTFADTPDAAEQCTVALIAVGTPGDPDGALQLDDLFAAVEAVVGRLAPGGVVAVKSTVPPGTCARLQARSPGANLASNPEFLREGCAVRDFEAPDRVVIGATDEHAWRALEALYAGRGPLLRMDPTSAELLKIAANTVLAQRVAFANELAALAHALGADPDAIRAGLAADHRIGPAYLAPSPGYGGSCLPKDVRALAALGRAHGAPQTLAEATHAANARQPERVAARIAAAVGGLAGKRIAVWGLAFKAGTDDTRASAAVAVARALAAGGAEVVAFDPEVPTLPGIHTAASALAAAAGADALAVLTEWPGFAAVDPDALGATLRGDVVVDCRGALPRGRWGRLRVIAG